MCFQDQNAKYKKKHNHTDHIRQDQFAELKIRNSSTQSIFCKWECFFNIQNLQQILLQATY